MVGVILVGRDIQFSALWPFGVKPTNFTQRAGTLLTNGLREIPCNYCDKRFITAANRRFCSNECGRAVGWKYTPKKPNKCLECGAPASRTFCSDKCCHAFYRPTHKLPPRKCEWCGEEYKPLVARQKRCSTACKLKATAVLLNQKRALGLFPPKLHDKVCPQCGGQFRGLKKRVFCNHRCSSDSKIVPDQPEPLGPPIPVDCVCLECGGGFRAIRKNSFCCIKHKKKHFRRIHRPKERQRSLFLEKTQKTSRQRRLNKIAGKPKDNWGWNCACCSIYSEHPSLFETDHIIPRHKGGKDKGNLQILCPNCHKIKTLQDVGVVDLGKLSYNPCNIPGTATSHTSPGAHFSLALAL